MLSRTTHNYTRATVPAPAPPTTHNNTLGIVPKGEIRFKNEVITQEALSKQQKWQSLHRALLVSSLCNNSQINFDEQVPI